MSDRDAFREARDVAKAKLHEKRLENATYTAAEVKVLTETATRLGREIGRKEALDEAAEAIEEASANIYYGDRHALHEAVEVVRNLTSQPVGAVSDEHSGEDAG